MLNSIALIIKLALVAIVIVGAVTVATYLTSSANIPPPSNLNSSNNATIQALKSTQLYQDLSSNRVIALSTLSQAQNSSENYNATYSGTVSYTGSISGIAVPLKFPITVQNQRFSNDSSIRIALRNVPLISHVNFSIIKFNGSIYDCAPNSVFSKNITYSCGQQQDQSSAPLNIFSLTGSGINVTVTNLYPSQYNGTPCVYVNSTFQISKSQSNGFLNSLASINGGQQNATSDTTGTLDSCINPANNLALTLNVGVVIKQTNSSTSLKISMAQVSNNNNVLDSQIRELPGPIQ